MKQHKLMNKALRVHLGYGFLVALVIIPVFYVLMKKYFIDEIDEFLFQKRDKIIEKNIRSLKISEISLWNQFNEELPILPDTGQTEDNVIVTVYSYNEYTKEREPFRTLYSRVEIEGGKYILSIQVSIEEFREALQALEWLLLLLLVCLMAGLIIITRLIHKKLWKPFYHTLSLTDHFNIRKNELPHFQATDIKEFNQLNQALEKLMGDNLQAYIIQKEFTENASHEMQTPLAVFRSKLDILLQQPALTEEQSTIIQTLHETVSRLVRMNNNLLLLAKMDNGQIPEHSQTLHVHEMVKESLSLLSGQAEASNITIKTYIDDHQPSIYAHQQLFECLVNNLLTNAIRHNVPGGKILMTLEADILTITNTGNDKPLDNDLLFRRFGRMNPTAKGSGLGLAIVRQICSLYGWQINYRFGDGMHKFEVNFHSTNV